DRGHDNVYNKAEVTTTFTPEEDTKAIRQFKEPTWTDIPDDIGDQNVWLEVDEVTDNGVYSYIQGRSNLIEGSRVFMKPGLMKVGETYVEKDGSFHFKLDYRERDKLV